VFGKSQCLANPNVQPDFYLQETWLGFEQNISKKIVYCCVKYSLDMTYTVFSMFQTQYILDFLSANTEISSLKMSLLVSERGILIHNDPLGGKPTNSGGSVLITPP
jgi:hypothetical protein